MADIQIPNRAPQGAGSPPAPPYDLVQTYLNRPFQYAQMPAQAANQVLENYYNTQKMKAAAFEAGGPYLMNQLYGGGSQPPQQPNTGQPTSAVTGTPGIAGTPSGNVATQTYGVTSPSAQTAPSGQIPETIQASLNMGHPDVTGLYSAGNPNLGVHAQKIMDLQRQMAQNQQMGTYGQKVNQGVNEQLGAEKALMEGEQFNAAQQRQQQQFEQGQAAEESRFERGQARQESQFQRGKVAEEVSKQGEMSSDIKNMKGMLQNLDKNLGDYYSGHNMPGSSNAYQLTKGRIGSQPGANVLNQGKPLVAAINRVLTRRFNTGENQLLSDSLAPSPNDTPQYAADKMRMLHQLITTMETGNAENVNNILSVVKGQSSGQQ